MTLPESQTLWLLLAVVLLFWLLTRQQQRRTSRPTRRNPITPDELGRVVFEIARARDLDGFRGLFVVGHEVREALGEGAEGYLARRTREGLAASLSTLGTRIPADSWYGSTRVQDGQATMEVRRKDGGVHVVPLGTVVRVGRVWRLLQAAAE